MFKLFLRDALIAGALLVLVAGAAALLGLPSVALGTPTPWTPELARIGADPTLLARDAALLLFALAALGGVAQALAAGLRLLGRDYPAAAHLAEALASRLVRRAAALAGVLLALLQSGAARASQPTPHDVGPAVPRATLVHRLGAPPTSHGPAPATGPAVVRPHVPSARRRRPVRRIGLAVRYIVQPDDTMDDVAARFGLPDWRPIMAATRGLSQPVGGPITDPGLIVPGQTLLIPLPSPALRLAGDHVLYVVQQGDYLSEIAARFLGDWRLYRQIGDLNRSVHQPDGGALENDNLIQPGWVLRLPQEYVVARPDGTTVTRRVVVDDTRPVRPRRGLRPRRSARPTQRGGAVPTPLPLPGARRSRRGERGAAVPADQHGASACVSPLSRRRPQPARPTEQPHRQPSGRGPDLHPRPSRAPRPVSPGVGSGQRRRTGQHRLVPRRAAPPDRRPLGPRPRPLLVPATRRPVVHVPDLGRDLPVAFVVGFLAVAAIAARRRRARRPGQGAGGMGLPGRWAGRLTGLAPSVQRALRAALDGVDGRLARALRRTPASTTGTARAAHVVATLERVGREAGVPYSLAGATRLLVEGDATLELVVAAPRLPDARVDDVARRLGAALGVPVRAARAIERDGTPVVTLTVDGGKLAAPAQVRPHPAPLLVPLGATAEGAVVHLHLGHTGGLLVAGGGQSLVATLLASAVYQAPPEALRLLVVSDDDELRKALPQLDHLEAPPADARDPRAVASIIAQAHTLVLDRYEHDSASAATTSGPPTPCLLVLAGIEGLDDAALDRLDAVAHTGPVCGVHLLATTSDPAALAANGMLALFRTRLARRLAPADNMLMCPDADAATLGPHEVLLCGLGARQRLQAFTLAPPEVREVFATVAASALPALPPVGPTPAAPPLPASPPPPPLPHDVAEAPTTPEELREPDAHDLSAEGAGAPAANGAGEEDATPPEEGEEDAALPEAGDDEGAASSPSSTAPVVGATGPPVRLELLGGMAVYVHGQPLSLYPRERNILAALAVLGPRPVRRDDLIEALFADDEDGGNTLSHALSQLRTVLRANGLPREQVKELVQRSSGGYSLHRDLVAVDLWRFDELLRQAEALDEDEAGPVLAEAFALYHGPLCAGEALDFVEERGYRWMQRVPTALYTLADSYRERGDLKAALHWARRLLTDEPCDDHANQLVLNLLAEMGDADGLDAHAEAMRAQYAACKLTPDPYTLRLYEQLRRKLRGASETKAG